MSKGREGACAGRVALVTGAAGKGMGRSIARTPQDVAEGVAHLCSDAGRFINGCELPYE